MTRGDPFDRVPLTRTVCGCYLLHYTLIDTNGVPFEFCKHGCPCHQEGVPA